MAWGKTTRSALLAASALASVAGPAVAQQTFTKIQAFGDSYVDTGNALAILKAFDPAEYAVLHVLYPTGRFSGGTNFVDTISSLLAIPQANFAIGGAEAGTGNTFTGLPGFQQESQGFLASGMKIAPSDLVVLNIGGNDARTYYQGGGALAGVPAAAATSAAQAIAGVDALVSAGAKTLVYTVGDVSTLPEAAAFPNAFVGSAYSQAYNHDTQAALGQIAAGGVRVEYVDISLVGNDVKADPAKFGITFTGACPLTCIGNSALQNEYLFYLDGIHLTSHGFAILGEYVVNRLEAPATLPPQSDVGSMTGMAFAQTLFSRLDMFGGGGSGAGFQRELADVPTHPTTPARAFNPLSVYMLVDGAAADGTSTTAGAGYTFTSLGGIVGAEYRTSENSLVGAAFNYDHPDLQLSGGRGSTQADSYQFGLYGTWTAADFFAQGVGLVGFQDYRNSRPGIIDTITSAPSGTTVVVGGKVGRLFDLSSFRVGPIAGLLYGRSQVDGFTENGDPALTLTVGRQTEDALVASGGAQIRFPFALAATSLEPYLNLTVESDVIGNGRIIQYGATSAPLIVNSLNVPDANSRRPYGRVAGGVAAPLTPFVALTAFATTTIDRPGGNDFSGSGGIKIAF